MVQSYYNITAHGTGFEGFLNYTNLLVEGWLVNLFLVMVFAVSLYTLSKSEWKLSSCAMFSSFLCVITAFIFRLFTTVNELTIFICIVALAISVVWARLDR